MIWMMFYIGCFISAVRCNGYTYDKQYGDQRNRDYQQDMFKLTRPINISNNEVAPVSNAFEKVSQHN